MSHQSYHAQHRRPPSPWFSVTGVASVLLVILGVASISILLTGGSSDVTLSEAKPTSPSLGLMIQAPTVAVTSASAAPAYLPGAEHPPSTPPAHHAATAAAVKRPAAAASPAAPQAVATTPAPTPPERKTLAAVHSSTAPALAPPSGSLGARLLAEAETQKGVPYVWAGDTPGGGFDCSGLIYWAANQIGITGMPRDTYGMLGQGVGSGLLVPVSSPVPGDLAFFGSGHVELYVRSGETFGAQSPGTSVGFHSYGYGYTPTAFYRVT